MGTEKMKVLTYESVYWVCMYADIYMPSLSANPAKRKNIHHNIPGKSWEERRADMFTLNIKYYLCIVDYQITRGDNV